jgi:hypothetical protein
LQIGPEPQAQAISPSAVNAAKARRVNRQADLKKYEGAALIEDNSLKRCCFYGKAAPPRGQIAGHRL